MAHNPGAALNDAAGGIKTSGTYDDRGDGTDDWFQYAKIANGGDVALGATTAAAVTNPASAGSLIALVKGWLTGLGQVGDTAVTNPSSSGSLIALLKGLLAGGQPTVPAHDTAVASLVVKASAGTLHSIVGTVAAGADGYLQIHDAASLPSNGAEPEFTFPVGAASADQPVQVAFPGHVCSTGIVVAWSTTRDTLTIGSGVLSILCHYV